MAFGGRGIAQIVFIANAAALAAIVYICLQIDACIIASLFVCGAFYARIVLQNISAEALGDDARSVLARSRSPSFDFRAIGAAAVADVIASRTVVGFLVAAVTFENAFGRRSARIARVVGVWGVACDRTAAAMFGRVGRAFAVFEKMRRVACIGDAFAVVAGDLRAARNRSCRTNAAAAAAIAHVACEVCAILARRARVACRLRLRACALTLTVAAFV